MVKQIFFQDFYLEDLTTHKRVLTLYNPYDQDITFKGKKKTFVMDKLQLTGRTLG
jgi:hypothetical protein